MKPETLDFLEKRIKIIRDKFDLSPVDPKMPVNMQGILKIVNGNRAMLGMKALFSRTHISKMVDRLALESSVVHKDSKEYSSLFFLVIVLTILGTERYVFFLKQLNYSDESVSSLSFVKDPAFPKLFADVLADEYPEFDEFKSTLESMGMEL